jgi:hypothetical protein
MATLLVNTGKAIVTNRVKNGSTGTTEPNYIHWGTGSGTTSATDTGLFSPASEARVAGTSSIITTTTTNDTYQVVGTLTSSSAQTITNAGLFDAATGGNLFVKGDFSGIPLQANDSIQFTFKWQIT